MKQFKYDEFYRIVLDMVCCPSNYSLDEFAQSKILNIINTEYEEQTDDIEYLNDLVNYYMRFNGLSYSRKYRTLFLNKISTYLNYIVKTSDFYIDEVDQFTLATTISNDNK